MRKKYRKLVSILLSVIMLIGVFPMTAMAEEPIMITSANAEITAPVGGEHPDSTLEASGEGYTVVLDYWYLNEGPYYPHLDVDEDVFETGKSYEVRFGFKAKDGYSFADDCVFTINGQETSRYVIDDNTYRQCGFTAAEDPKVITSANAVITAPVGGEHPDSTFEASDERYTVELNYWYLNEPDYPPLNVENDVFETGKSYAVRTVFKAKEGYSFADDCVFTINGDGISCYYNSGNNSIRYPEADFVATAPAENGKDVISEIEGTSDDFETIPKFNGITKKPEFTVTKGSPAILNSVMFYWQKWDAENEKWETINGETLFTAGKWRGFMQVRIDSEDYTLEKGNLEVTINGKDWPVEPEEPFVVTETYSYAWISSPEFTIEDDGTEVTYIEKVELSYTGFEVGADVTGFNVTTETEGVEDVQFYIYIHTDDEDYVEVEDGKFEEDCTYYVSTYTTAEKGYVFVGMPIYGITMEGAKRINDDVYIRANSCVADFILGEEQDDGDLITSLSATVAAPRDGEHPSITASAGSEDYKTYVYGWYEGGTVDEPGPPIEDPGNYFFEKDRTYLLAVIFTSEDKEIADYATATINGKTATHVLDIPGGSVFVVALTAAGTGSDEENIITSLSATVTTPEAGKHPALTLTTPSDKYTAEVDMWYEGGTVDEPGTSIENPEEYTFKAGQTYILDVIFIPANEDVIIADDATATINGKTAKMFDIDYVIYSVEFKVPASSNDDDDNTGSGEGGSSSIGSSSSSSSDYVEHFDINTGDGFKVNKKRAATGSTVTITVDEGIKAEDIIVTTKSGKVIELKDKGNGVFTFVMPADDITIEIKETAKDIIDEEKCIILTIDKVVAKAFGESVTNDVAPVIRNDRTMLPIRFIAEALGAEVKWDDETDKVTIIKDGIEIIIFIGSAVAFVNNETVELDSPAFIENSRTYLPIRFVAENLGAEVKWNDAEKTVTVIPAE